MSDGEILIPFTVEHSHDGWRLDRFLLEKIGRMSRARAQRLIREALVYVPPTRTPHETPPARLKASTLVWTGLTFSLRRTVRLESPDVPPPPPVIYRDGALLVIDKPAGLTLHPTASTRVQTLTTALRTHFSENGAKPDPAHRLDRETSGLIACGMAPRFTARLKAQFAARTVKKRYLAFCEGAAETDFFEIALPLALNGGLVQVRMAPRADGAPALTRVRVLARFVDGNGAPLTLVEAEPLTGRQHQIRVHLASVGLPIVGDKLYGPDEQIFLRLAESRRPPAPIGTFDPLITEEERAKLRLPRHALHAAFLSIAHPETGALIELTSPLPPDLAEFQARLLYQATVRESPSRVGTTGS